MATEGKRGPAGLQGEKKTYIRPQLRSFGALHKVTQGSMFTGSDGAGDMTRNMG